MILGIDASNLRVGGGVTHLVELLQAAEPLRYGFTKVIVWSSDATLSQIEDRPWLLKSHVPFLNRNLLYRIYWQRFNLSPLARKFGCDILFVPGGMYTGNFHPMVTMSRNLLPFEWRELLRYGWSLTTLKLILLRWIQTRTFRIANGLVFLTQYAHVHVMRVVKNTSGRTAIISHGINNRFIMSPRIQRPISHFSVGRPFRILYVSAINVYKHQWHVAAAVAQLRQSGLPIVLDLVGLAYPPALHRLRKTLRVLDPTGQFVRYVGVVPYEVLHKLYKQAELCLFASSCENLPNILLEGMSSGLPIVCSNRGPMPEFLGNAGIYFNPENPKEIAVALKKMIDSPELRAEKAKASFAAAQGYSWARCANETFGLLADVARANY